ncbi:glycan biosynthesis hexose transferase WsfD [Marinisporobacter balticus]|uniref:Transmembrane protein n=1 Tax=Marinisporobacter balticus TaxID=2018667 RepID=A0A4R2KRV2_9FIRM|nr:hypothetical protein [Marinisporobacter balticus]TCO69365.1 hypothetical protein EV214_13231 [Marinisporobacter balticus]
MKKIPKPSVIAVILLILISGYALFLEPLIGLADNGDFYRIMAPNDLKHEESRNKNDYFGYFNHKYDKLQYYNELKGNIKSTHSIFIKIAMKVDDLVTHDKKFDIRFHGLLCLMVLALAVYWMVEIVEKMTESMKVKYFMGVMAVFIFGDIGYISYFNSFFGEAIAYSCYLLSIAGLLKFIAEKEFRIKYVVVFSLATFMFMGAKNQFAPNGILAFVVLFVFIFFKINRKKKIIIVTSGVVLLISTLVMYAVINDNIYLINKYHMITRGVMLFEPDVQEVTQEVGINEQYALLAGTIYFDGTPVVDPRDEVLLKGFYSQYNLASVTLYYFKNPKAFEKMMRIGWKNSFTIRPEVVGNYERNVGMEYAKRTNFFCLWSYLKENHIPKSSGLIYMFLCICAVLSINRYLGHKRKNNAQRGMYMEIVMLYVFLTGLSQIFVSFIGAGDTDLRKHLFMNTLALDILFYFNFSNLISILFKKRG